MKRSILAFGLFFATALPASAATVVVTPAPYAAPSYSGTPTIFTFDSGGADYTTRFSGGGVVSGSGAAFLVLESRDHAAGRGRKAYAELGKIASGRARRGTALEPALAAMLQEMGADKADLVVSGASGAHEPTAAEAAVLQRLGLPVRGWSTLAGHLRDAQFPFSVALAALAVGEGVAYPSSDDLERPVDGAVETVLATTVGYHYFEGMALVTAAK